MNQDQAEWYAEMAKALKARDHAVRMIKRWQQQLADAEGLVEKLSASVSRNEAAAEVFPAEVPQFELSPMDPASVE